MGNKTPSGERDQKATENKGIISEEFCTIFAGRLKKNFFFFSFFFKKATVKKLRSSCKKSDVYNHYEGIQAKPEKNEEKESEKYKLC
jgi:hypothetical protein